MNGAGPRGSVITRVTPIAIDKFLFVEVETRDGIVGTGEASSWAHLEATEAAIGKFGDYLVGRSACDIAHHWEVMRRFGSYSGSVIMAAISAIDAAYLKCKGVSDVTTTLFGQPRTGNYIFASSLSLTHLGNYAGE